MRQYSRWFGCIICQCEQGSAKAVWSRQGGIVGHPSIPGGDIGDGRAVASLASLVDRHDIWRSKVKSYIVEGGYCPPVRYC